MPNPTYDIYIRDRNLQRIGAVTQYNKLELNMQYNNAGAWVLDMPDNDVSGSKLLELVRAQGGGLGGIIVEREGQVIFSGPVHGVEATANYLEDETAENISFWGTDDTGLLLSRLAMPPRPSDGQYGAFAGTGANYDKITDKAETVMIHLVQVNATTETINPRVINGLTTEADQGRGATVTIRSRYHSLIEKLQEAATAGGLGFRVLQTSPGSTTFQVYESSDKTKTVIFSRELGNLGSYRYKVEKPETNFVIVGGGGEDVARVFRYSGDEPSRSLYGTWEMFKDQRHTSDAAELDQAMYEELTQKTESIELEIQPLNVRPTRFMTDYELGDKATVVIKDERIEDIIRSIKITLTPEQGEVVTPTIGTPGVGTTFRLFDAYRNLEARIGNLETV